MSQIINVEASIQALYGRFANRFGRNGRIFNEVQWLQVSGEAGYHAPTNCSFPVGEYGTRAGESRP